MAVFLRPEGMNPWLEMEAYTAGQPLLAGRFGATAIFIGSMRDLNLGRAVTTLTLEHYPGMTERVLAAVETEARARWELLDVLMVHRVGVISVQDPIVVVAVWSAHRAEAFEACRYLMEALKSRAPFWKREQTAEGVDAWVHAGAHTGARE